MRRSVAAVALVALDGSLADVTPAAIHLLAFHSRALTPAEIATNHGAGADPAVGSCHRRGK